MLRNCHPRPRSHYQPSRPRVKAKADRTDQNKLLTPSQSNSQNLNRFLPCFYLSIKSEDYLRF